MWCKSCQQDVPALSSGHTGSYSCPRCGAGLCDGGHPRPATQTRAVDAPPQARTGPKEAAFEGGDSRPPAYDGWELEQQLRHIERLLRIDRLERHEHGAAAGSEQIRFDAAHAGPLGWHYPAAMRARADRNRRAAGSRAPEAWLPVLTWLVLAVGLMGSACGGALLAWAAAAGRQELWAIGIPVGLGGQIVLVLGLILQLDRLWHNHRHTAEKLDHVDERLDDLNKTTTLLGASRGAPSSSFPSHMAGSLSPQLLLADLKSQLDLLTVKLAQAER